MDYEKAYKEALERARSYYNNEEVRVGMTPIELEEIFPELGESEDERIRKALVRFHKSTIDVDGIKGEEIVAWLEKQGQETSWKPSKGQINALEHFVRSIGESGYASPYDNNTKLLVSLLHDLEKLEKQGEKKPTWSVEDKKRIDRICDFVWKNRKGDTDEIYQQEQDVNWLKSLKERIGE